MFLCVIKFWIKKNDVRVVECEYGLQGDRKLYAPNGYCKLFSNKKSYFIRSSIDEICKFTDLKNAVTSIEKWIVNGPDGEDYLKVELI